MPDLSIIKNVNSAQWRNTLIDLGSDHYIVETLLVAGPMKSVGRKHTVIDWDLFRKIRQMQDCPNIEDVEEWVKIVHEHIDLATKIVPEEANLKQVDSRLVHM